MRVQTKEGVSHNRNGLITRDQPPSTRYQLHSKAWAVWLLAGVTAVFVTQNSFYLLLVILATSLNYFSFDRTSPIAQGWGAFLRLGLVLILFSVGFNLLFVRAGATPLFTLPELSWDVTNEQGQVTLFQVGGEVSLESLVYGLNTGLALMALLLTFATFNSQVNHYQLLRSMPRFLYQSAIVMSIAVTFIPHMFVAQREIREAQALRGHRFRGIQDLLPLLVTLLAEGLERSLTLAESMEARGFRSQPVGTPAPTGLLLKSLIAVALIILISGALAWSYFSPSPIGGVMMLGGTGLLGAVIWRIGRNVQHSRYRRTLWRQADTLVVVAALIVMLVMLTTWLTQRSALIFYPYPRLHWPAFNPLIGLTLLLIAAPVLVGRLTRLNHYD